MPRVSIIVPERERERLLLETMASVSAQTFRVWECIVVDDGSTYHSYEVAKNQAN